jgi:hypothetical protein
VKNSQSVSRDPRLFAVDVREGRERPARITDEERQ